MINNIRGILLILMENRQVIGSKNIPILLPICMELEVGSDVGQFKCEIEKFTEL